MQTQETETPKYNPSEKEKEILASLRSDWSSAYTQKTRTWRQLRNWSVDTFMQKMRDHYNGYTEPLDEVEQDWRSNIFKRKTRHKVMAVCASFVASGLGVEISAQDLAQRIDRAMSKVTEEIYEWSLEREDFDVKFLAFLIEVVITGTGHMSEEIVWETRNVKEITDMDFATGKVKTEKGERITFKGCKSEFIPNSEIFIGDAWTHEVQEQPYIFRRKVTTFQNAEGVLGKYANWKYVQKGLKNFFPVGEEDTDRESADDDNNDVEILYYWNKQKDEYFIVANGVLLTETDSCIPYPHKNYPIIKTVFEVFADSRFYWGDSLVNKNYDEQEMINKLTNWFADATLLQTFPPLFTTNSELAGTDLVIPGLQATMEAEDTFRTIPEITKGVSNSQFAILQGFERQIDENSIDPLLAGQTPQGDPTATEVRAIAGSAERIKELNELYIGSALIQMANLRIPNLLWFVTHDDEYKKIVLNDVKTSLGKDGKRIIKFVDAVEMPNPEDLFVAQERLDKMEEPTDFVFVDKNNVNEYRYHVKLSVIRKPSRSHANRIARILSKYRIYASNQMIDQTVNTRMLVEALGDDADELIAARDVGTVQPQQRTGLPPQSPQLDKALANQFETNMPV